MVLALHVHGLDPDALTLTLFFDPTPQDLLQKEFLLESRQMKLLGELQGIYPIERLENQEYAIRGLELPTDIANTSRDDEHISSALGYVCHLVFMLSKYLQVSERTLESLRADYLRP